MTAPGSVLRPRAPRAGFLSVLLACSAVACAASERGTRPPSADRAAAADAAGEDATGSESPDLALRVADGAQGLASDVDEQDRIDRLAVSWSAERIPAGARVEWSAGYAGEAAGGVFPWTAVVDRPVQERAGLAIERGRRVVVAFRIVADGGRGPVLAQRATDGVTVRVLGGETGVVRRIERHGVAWTFARPLRSGAFANGDPWVVGPAAIVRIEPGSTETPDGRRMHGSMLDPDPRHPYQGYDSAARVGYEPELDVGFGIGPDRPLLVEPGRSLVTCASIEEPGQRPQLRTAAVLTVVAEPPPRGAFRPSYAGGATKDVFLRRKDIRWSLLQSRRLPGGGDDGGIDLDGLVRHFERVWLDHQPGWTARFLHPQENMPDYGRDMAARISDASLALHLEMPRARKEALLVPFLQLGIDLYGIVEGGGVENWTPLGGHTQGRKWPILFAGLVLGHEGMAKIGERDDVLFGEDAQTFFVEETAPGVVNGGHGGYGPEHVGMAEWGIRHATQPERDSVEWETPYRICCTAKAWTGFVLAARIMGAQEAWGHDALFAYQDRYMARVPERDRAMSDFARRCWEEWR